MDSLTQIVLGASVGEAVLGKKIGNRAILWGAIGGTIPDLDVLADNFMNKLDAMVVHRGITHSLFFAIFAPLIAAWLISYLYRSGLYRILPYKLVIACILIVGMARVFFEMLTSKTEPGVIVIVGMLFAFLLYRLYAHYIAPPLRTVDVRFSDWYMLFFLAFLTHLVLDCFTTYGTQVLLPFSNTRVAFSTISVVDPLYTLPFLLCMIGVMLSPHGGFSRPKLNRAGIIISSTYLLLTVFNKLHTDRTFATALEHRQIVVTRAMTSPTILNNVLWNCVAESPDTFYYGMYSKLDSEKYMHHINALPRNTDIEQRLSCYKDFHTLHWFSNGYLLAYSDSNRQFLMADLRFGAMQDSVKGVDDFVFSFNARESAGRLELLDQNRPDVEVDLGDVFRNFVQRLKGY